MAVRDDRSGVKQTTTGFRGPLMVQSLTSAKSKFLSLPNFIHQVSVTTIVGTSVSSCILLECRKRPIKRGRSMARMQAGVAAIELRRPSNWRDECKAALRALGFETADRGNSIYAWRVSERIGFAPKLEFVDGFSLSRLWIAPKNSAISASPRRMYFDLNREEIDPSGAAERKILSGRRRPAGFDDRALLDRTLTLIGALKDEKSDLFGREVEFSEVFTNLESKCKIAIQASSFCASEVELNGLYRDYGFDFVPDGFTIFLVATAGIAQTTQKEYEEKLLKVLADRGIHGLVRLTDTTELKLVLADIDNTKAPRKNEALMVQLLLPMRDKPLLGETLELVRWMDEHHIPWRRAYQNDPFRFSVPNQLPSLLQAAGGRSHRVTLTSQSSDVWTIGVDLSHKKDLDYSTLCCTLVDPQGALVSAWKCSQPRDETPNIENLRGMLDSAFEIVKAHDEDSAVLVIRDGRLFNHEPEATYLKNRGLKVSLIECRKYGNPPLFLRVDDRDVLPNSATWAQIEGAGTAFFVPLPQRTKNTMDTVLKITWEPEWDGANLGAERFSEILTALTFAPSLGLHRQKLPAPIYWADGIAGCDDTDLRFRGETVIEFGAGSQ